MKSTAGYEEIAHTADWELHVWAPDLITLLEQAACGMYALSGTRLAAGPPQTRQLNLHAADPERMLVAFLSELLWLGERDGLAFDAFDLQLEGETLNAVLQGAPIAAQAKEIKAVTFHKLAIKQAERSLEVNIVFDV
jgi:SHS2 domain-containing protein